MAEEGLSGGMTGKALVLLAILAVGFAATNAYIAMDNYSKYGKTAGSFTGFAADEEGYVNVTVVASVVVNFTKQTINWGIGSITAGEFNASLTAANGAGTAVLRGNWSTTDISPFQIQNIGSINVSLRLQSGKDAEDLFAGSVGHRAYLWNVTNDKAGSCNGGGSALNAFLDANKTAQGTSFCAQFGFLSTQDMINVSTRLVIPYDGLTGLLSDTITAVAATA